MLLGSMKMGERHNRLARWECVFKAPFLRTEINARLYERDPRTPFGMFSKIWREEHCRTLNPYGSEDCPYDERDCALAYYAAVSHAQATPGVRSMPAFFRSVAKRMGLERADDKPLARDRVNRRTNGRTEAPRSGDAGAEGRGTAEGRAVSRTAPRSLASLFGEDDG